MTLAVTLLALVVVLLSVLVAGLLRSHAVILRRLHELGAGVDDAPTRAPGPARPAGVPETAPTGRPAHDLAGVTPSGGAVALRAVGAAHDTVLVFLSSGCATCGGYWEALRAGEVRLPEGARLVVVVRDPAEESPALLAELAPPDVTVVLSSAAWDAYAVPGSPYVVHVDGPGGRIVGEGTAGSWEQVARLLADATGDLGYVGGPRRGPRARADRLREEDTDRALLAAGILPGDPRLYAGDGADTAGVPGSVA